MKQIRKTASVLASVEIWFVGAAVAAGFLANQLLPVAVILAVIFWLLRGLAYGVIMRRSPADWAIVCLVLMLPVTLWASALPEVTRPQIFRLLGGVALYYAIVNWAASDARLRWLGRAAAAAGFFLSLFALVSVEWFTDKLSFFPAALYSHFRVLVSDAIHPNVMAGSLVILLPVALAVGLFAWKQINWLERILLTAAVVGMLGVLILTVSRGAWLAFTIVLLILTMLRWRWGWLVLVLAALVGGLAIYIFGAGKILEALASSGALGGIEGRLEVWSRAIFMIQDFPFTGIGMGTFGQVADALYPFFLAEPGSRPQAHNLFLQIAVDVGIPGLIAWLAILCVMLTLAWQLHRLGRVRGNIWIAGLGAGLFCSQLALIIHGLLDAVTWGMVRSAPIVWALWGLTSAAWMLNRKPQS